MAKKTDNAAKDQGSAATAPAATESGAAANPGNLPAAAQNAAESTAAALAKREFAIMRLGDTEADVREAFTENLGIAKLTAFDLSRVKVPAGAGGMWKVPTPEGEKFEPAIEGIIVKFYDAKAYWRDSIEKSGGGSPPNCQSYDMEQGVGDPGILCAKCGFNQFGSDTKSGRGKACKDHRVLFIVRPGDTIPIVVTVPPTSLKALKQFFVQLAGRGTAYWKCIVRLELKSDNKNAGNIEYSSIIPKLVRVLGDDEKSYVSQYVQVMKGIIGNPQLTASDLRGEESDAGARPIQPTHNGAAINTQTGEVIDRPAGGGKGVASSVVA